MPVRARPITGGGGGVLSANVGAVTFMLMSMALKLNAASAGTFPTGRRVNHLASENEIEQKRQNLPG